MMPFLKRSQLYVAIGAALTLSACGGDNETVVSKPPIEVPDVGEPVSKASNFVVFPYLQNPAADAMTIMWFSDNDVVGELEIEGVGTFKSQPKLATDLDYSQGEIDYIHGEKNFGKIHATLSKGEKPVLPYQHIVRVTGLTANTAYVYRVQQGNTQASFESEFKTAPASGQIAPVKFVVMSDMETEPESTQKSVKWAANSIKINGWKLATDPSTASRDYLVDQTTGYKQTLAYAAKSKPAFWLIAGDLVEKGGRQLDWDEFWRHAAGEWGTLASTAAILPALGNHENYWHPTVSGGYVPDAVKRSYNKWKSYWDVPSNQAKTDARYESRYYRVDYGPVTIITLDSSNGDDSDMSKDTNLMINGQDAHVPDFNYGSEQWQWAVSELADARAKGQVIFVQWHHMAYGTGVHSLTSGTKGIANNEDNQSGLPMRVYHDLMKQYDVAAVFSGHNELLETVELDGVHYWDVGISGDGLRGPGYYPTTSYVPFDLLPTQAQQSHWSAHGDSQEMWVGQKLIDGGKHYGFVEVDVKPTANHAEYEIVIRPKYSLPVVDDAGKFTGEFKERVYDKVLRITQKI